MAASGSYRRNLFKNAKIVKRWKRKRGNVIFVTGNRFPAKKKPLLHKQKRHEKIIFK
jgi:hypothetical protein